jgi:hypothetical protein
MTPGYYTSTTFVASLKTAITTTNVALAGFDVTYNETTNKLTFTNAAAFQLLSTSTMFPVIGFNKDSNKPLAAAAVSVTSEKMIDLSGVNSFYVCSDLSIQNQGFISSSSPQNTNILGQVFLTSDTFGIEFFTNQSPFKNKFYNRVISSLRIQLYDENFNTWNPSSDWSLVLEFTFFEKFDDAHKSTIKNDELIKLKNF